MKPLAEQLEEEFALVRFLKKYTDFVFIEKTGENAEAKKMKLSKGTSISFGPSTRTESDGKIAVYSTSVSDGIDSTMFEARYQKHLQDEQQLHDSLSENDFLEDQCNFLRRLDERLTRDYKYLVRPLKKFLTNKRELLSTSSFTNKTKRQLSAAGKKGRRQPDLLMLSEVVGLLVKKRAKPEEISPMKAFQLVGAQTGVKIDWLKKHIKTIKSRLHELS